MGQVAINSEWKKMPLINEESKKKISSIYVKSYILYLEYVPFPMTFRMCS